MLSDSEYKRILDSKLEDFIKESEVLEMYKDYAWELINQGVFDEIDPDVAFEWMRITLKYFPLDALKNKDIDIDSGTLYLRTVYENDEGFLLYLGKFKE